MQSMYLRVNEHYYGRQGQPNFPLDWYIQNINKNSDHSQTFIVEALQFLFIKSTS